MQIAQINDGVIKAVQGIRREPRQRILSLR